MSKGDKEEALNVLLQKQYCNAEEYCNSQTRLHRSLATNGFADGTIAHMPLEQLLKEDSLQRNTEELIKSLDRVRSDLKELSSLVQDEENTYNKIWKEHLAISRRAVKTMYNSGGRFHPSGIPVGKDDSDTKMIALATLRASIAKVKSSLSSE